MRVLVAGWASFWHGEATAGDVLSMACGPAHGDQLTELHRYADCRRIAVGVSVIDPDGPAVTGFHRVLARDGSLSAARPDLALTGRTKPKPVIGVILAPGQAEYGARRRHDTVHEELSRWLTGLDCARRELDTRLDTRDWRHCATPDQFHSVLARLDAVISTRLHGCVFGLRAGVPVLAVDPVAGGGKVTAQAAALGRPALVAAQDAGPAAFDRWWGWCLSPAGRARAAEIRDRAAVDHEQLDELVRDLRSGAAV